jgi:hypothetical protein
VRSKIGEARAIKLVDQPRRPIGPRPGELAELPDGAIEYVEIRDRSRGAVFGAVAGAYVGLAVGFAYGNATSSDVECPEGPAGVFCTIDKIEAEIGRPFKTAMIGLPIGAAAGALIGLASGMPVRYLTAPGPVQVSAAATSGGMRAGVAIRF